MPAIVMIDTKHSLRGIDGRFVAVYGVGETTL